MHFLTVNVISCRHSVLILSTFLQEASYVCSTISLRRLRTCLYGVYEFNLQLRRKQIAVALLIKYSGFYVTIWDSIKLNGNTEQ